MTPEDKEILSQFVDGAHATTYALLCLIQDLAPIIGYAEAHRLVDIIGNAQMDNEEKGENYEHNT